MKIQNKPYPLYDTPEIKDFRHLIEYGAKKNGDKTLFWWLEKKTECKKSYKEFKADVEALGTYFISRGFKGTHIALISENSYEAITTYFAIVNSGNVVVALAKDAPIDEMKYLYNKSDSTVIIHSKDYKEEAEQIDCETLLNLKDFAKYVNEGMALIADGNNYYGDIVPNNRDLAVLVFTSGSTGEPKGVMLSSAGMTNGMVGLSKNIKFPDSALFDLPLNHIFAILACAVAPMLASGTVFINKNIKNLAKDLKYSHPKYIPGVPLMIEAIHRNIQEGIKKSGKEDLINKLIKVSNGLLKIGIDVRRKLFKSIIDGLGGDLELVVVSGAALNEKIFIDFRNYGINVVNAYGMTECIPVTTMRNEYFDTKSIGLPPQHTKIRIVDDEIQVYGPGLFMGYYKNEEATKDAFDGEWFKTGDLGKEENGLYYLTGRKKNLIILSNGENVSPEELEQKLMAIIPQIAEVVVREKDNAIAAELYCPNCDDEKKKEIEKAVFENNKNLPTYKHIAQVDFRDTEFSKTSTRKIKRD